MSKLNTPSKKCFVKFLKNATMCQESEGRIAWTCTTGLKFSNIWLQGKLVEDSPSDFLLDDSTGVCRVVKIPSAPSSSHISVGGYVMVIGELIRSGEQPVVRSLKVQDLSSDELLAEMWPFEVRDIQSEYM